jgi:hypothetical protein
MRCPHLLLSVFVLVFATGAAAQTTTLTAGSVLVAYDSGLIASTTGTSAATCTPTGTVPPGLSCYTSTTVIATSVIRTSAGLRGTPTTAGTYTFSIFGQSFRLTINSPTALKEATVGVAYDSGTLRPNSVRCAPTGSIPPGLACYVSGVTAAYGLGIRGTPTQAGTFTFTLDGQQSFSLTVNPAPSPTLTLKAAAVGVAYDSGVVRPNSVRCAPTGSTPPGLACYASTTEVAYGLGIRGTPTQAGTFTFTLDGQQSFSLTVNQSVTVTVDSISVTSVSGTVGAQIVPIEIKTSGPQVPFTATVTQTTPAARVWLAVSATSGVAPTTLRAILDSTGLAPGTYRGNIRISVAGASSSRAGQPAGTGSTVDVPVTLTVSGDVFTFYYVQNGPLPTAKTLSVNPVGAANAAVSTFANVNQPAGGTWLSVTPPSGTAPLALSISVNPSGLAAGAYTGSVSVFVTGSPTDSRNVSVTLVVLAAPNETRTFSYQAGGAQPASQDLSISSGGAQAVNFVTDIAAQGGNWFSVSPASGVTPVTLTLSVSPSGLTAGIYRALLAVLDPADPQGAYTVLVILTVNTASGPVRQVISHLADGGGWKTTIILVNLDAQPAQFTLSFRGDDGTPYFVPVAGLGARSAINDSIPVGGSRTIETAGTARDLASGWAEISSSQKVSGTAIFLAVDSGQEAAVPFSTAGSGKLLLPYDTSAGLVLGVAFANGSSVADGSPSIVWRNQDGRALASPQNQSLPSLHHTALVVNNPSAQPGDQRGVLELTSQASLYALGIRFNGTAFTSIEAVGPQERGNRTISHIADGGGWRTTIVLVNADSSPAAFTLNFFGEDGSPMTLAIAGRGRVSSISDTIPVGGGRTYETNGTEAVVGWALVTTSQSVGGTAIFRAVDSGQEAAVPLLAAGASKLLIPYDTSGGLALGIAFANPSATNDVTVTVTARNEQGRTIASDRKVVPARGHSSLVFSNPSGAPADQRGVLELSAPSTIFALGIRANAQGAFTSIRALGN